MSSRATSASASVVTRSARQVGVLARAAHGDAGQFQRRADAGGQVVGLLVQQPHDLRADDAAPEQGDSQCVAHRISSGPLAALGPVVDSMRASGAAITLFAPQASLTGVLPCRG